MPTNLSNIVVELRSAATGKKLQTTQTAGDGTYQFPNLTLNTQYYVVPVLNRHQTTTAPSTPVLANTSVPNLPILGVPATVTISDVPSTLVLITTYPYTYSNPPKIDQTAASVSSAFTATIGSNGSAVLSVPAATTYSLACWKLQNGVYGRSGGSLPLGTINPLDTPGFACPQSN